jgi:parallel beta-helix repeat protein
VFYVDSATGNDSNNGTQATTGSAPKLGPWRSLARLMTAPLQAGDTVQLACSSVWNETLRVPLSGTAAAPISVRAAPNCTVKPTIDGGTNIAPGAWVQHAGNVFKTTLAAPVLQLHGNATGWLQAHHPNRGFDAAQPANPYLRLASSGNVVTVAGRQGSSVLTAGSDLKLPPGSSTWQGARLRVRTNAYVIDDVGIASFDGTRFTLDKPTTHPVAARWGYLLTGQLWMLDSASEWFYSSTNRTLYAWMPNAAVPRTALQATTLPVGVDLDGRQHVVIDGLTIKRVGTGMFLRRTLAVAVRNSSVEDTADMGIDADGSNRLLVENNLVRRTGIDAINGDGRISAVSQAMTVRNNVVRDSGVLMQGEQVASLPRRSVAAIHPGNGGKVQGNTIVNAGYIGVLVGANSLIENNYIEGVCSLQDDCGAIYTGGLANRSVIQKNTVYRARGFVYGKPAADTQAQGIYLDDLAAQITVQDNTVIDTDHGIQLHNGSNNVLRNNRLYGNRKSQMWFQEDSNIQRPAGDQYGNVVSGNLLAPVSGTASGYLLSSRFASVAAFASFDGNRYFDRRSGVIASSTSSSGLRTYAFDAWRAALGEVSPSPIDGAGLAISASGFAPYRIASNNLVANASFTTDLAGWRNWNATAPRGQSTRVPCPTGYCLQYTAGGSAGIVSSPGFSVRQGQWYRLTVDVASEQNNQFVPLVVRVAGADYGRVSDRTLNLTTQRSWGRYSVVFQATRSVDPSLAATAGLLARVDFDGIETGRSITFGNLELVAITPDGVAQSSAVVVNAGEMAVLAACPIANTNPAACSRMRNLADDLPVAWPASLPARGSLIVYAQEPTLLDGDRDGIPDSQDRCAGTARGNMVNAAGCAFTQR